MGGDCGRGEVVSLASERVWESAVSFPIGAEPQKLTCFKQFDGLILCV